MLQKTILDQVERCPDGFIRIGFQKQWLNDQGEVVEQRHHLQGVPPGCSLSPGNPSPTPETDIAWMLDRVNEHLTERGKDKYAPLPDCSRAIEACAAAAAASDGQTTFVVNFNQARVGVRREEIGDKAKAFGVRERADFLAAFPRAQALHDLVFTPELCAADDAAKAKEEADRVAAEEADLLAAAEAEGTAREAFDAAVAAKVAEEIARLGLTAPPQEGTPA